MVVAGGLSIYNVVFSRAKWLAAAAFLLLAVTLLLGGSTVQVEPYPEGTPYIGLDWFILDLLGSALIFIFIEKLFPLRKSQPVFRPHWQTDAQHFLVNHLIVGFIPTGNQLTRSSIVRLGHPRWRSGMDPGLTVYSRVAPHHSRCRSRTVTGPIARTTKSPRFGDYMPFITAQSTWTG